MKKLLLILLCCVLALDAYSQRKIKVACVGNSITYGHGMQNRDKDAYPAQLQAMLGNGYDVLNAGVSARTMLNKGDHPYMKEKAFHDALNFNPDIVVIKLGTNDTKPQNWKYSSEFEHDMSALVDSFLALPSKPAIWLCTPIPAFGNTWNINDSIVVNGVIPIVKKVAKKYKLKKHLINLYKPFKPHPELVSKDKIHPNKEGYGKIAEIVCKKISKH